MRFVFSSVVVGLGLIGGALEAVADSRTDKYRSRGCDIERKYDDDGKFEEKIECKPGAHGISDRLGPRSGKEEYRRGNCEIKREWKENGEYKEEVKCR
jgi:hypothetical protein